MTAAAELLDRLHALGFQVAPEPPETIRVRYVAGRTPPPDTPALLDELRQQKAEILQALTSPARWDDAFEKSRLDSLYNWADDEPNRRGLSWSDAWRTASQRHRAAMDTALDAISEAWHRGDVAAHIGGCDALRRLVLDVLREYGAARGSAWEEPPS